MILTACHTENKTTTTDTAVIVVAEDLDGDGYDDTEDCDDDNAMVYPNGDEICDGIDNNCDGLIDEDVLTSFYADSDGDGYGNPDILTEGCELPEGYSNNGSDCDDGNNQSHPGADEICDGEDNNCNEEVDEDLNIDFYIDLDGDGFGNDDNIVSECQAELGLATIGGDCDDENAAISPIATEVCDEVDNNCNEEIDEGVQTTYYLDFDTDGFGDAQTTLMACTPAEGYVLNDDDCNDTDSQAYPNAVEFCDNTDNNCDGAVDEDSAIDTSVWYADFDNDGFGTPDSTYNACTQPSNYSTNALDCNDGDDDINPNAVELCNEEDDNCDGVIDEDTASDASTWFQDADEDGFGNNSITTTACSIPSGYTSNNTDCDDYDDDTNPSADEACNGEDDNCDGIIDEDTAIDASVWFQDADEDGYGDASITQTTCDAPSGFVVDNTDCNDINPLINPMASEVCNEEDDDCNGDVDDYAIDSLVFYEDLDEDGFGNLNQFSIACEAPSGYLSNASDCDDDNENINPSAIERCNSIDDNCDGIIDDASLGDDATCPAESCNDLLAESPSTPDGSYWIDPDGSGSVETYCNMTLAGGGWTLVAKFSNQDSRHWADSETNWVTDSTFGSTADLSDGSDAKSALWSRMNTSELMLNDHLNLTDFIYTDDDCIGGTDLADYFGIALASFPYTGTNYYDACAVQFSYVPNWGTEPNWGAQTATSSQIGLNASGTIAIAKTDSGGDTSGVISLYEATDEFEADVGLGALENGQSYTDDGYSQDIGGPTSCGYDDATCASEYPETVFFWIR
jgi:hypothetical protein